MASDPISEAVQLPPSFAPAQQWHFHGVTALKFADGRGQAGMEGCEGSIVREWAHLTPRNIRAVLCRQTSPSPGTARPERAQPGECLQEPGCKILTSLILGNLFGTGSFGCGWVPTFGGSQPRVKRLPSPSPWDNTRTRHCQRATSQLLSCHLLECQSIVSRIFSQPVDVLRKGSADVTTDRRAYGAETAVLFPHLETALFSLRRLFF